MEERWALDPIYFQSKSSKMDSDLILNFVHIGLNFSLSFDQFAIGLQQTSQLKTLGKLNSEWNKIICCFSLTLTWCEEGGRM